MPDALLIAVVLAAGLACPLMMLVAHRRGRQAPCCPPTEGQPQQLEHLRAERERLSKRIAELQG